MHCLSGKCLNGNVKFMKTPRSSFIYMDEITWEQLRNSRSRTHTKATNMVNDGRFKEGHIPWNKGLRGIMVPWNKGKHGIYSRETIRRNSEAHKKPRPNRRKVKLSRKELVDLYEKQKLSINQIAERLQVSGCAIRGALIRNNIPRRGVSDTKRKFFLTREELASLYWIEHLSPIEIAQKIKCSKQTVHYWLRQFNIPRRLQREANELNWSKSTYREKTLRATFAALKMRPTKPEKIVKQIIKNNNLPFKYVGNGEVIISGCNPDFISTDNANRIIEVFGRPFHDPFSSFRVNIRCRQSYWGRKCFFKSLGYDLMILWADELMNKDEVERKISHWDNVNFNAVGLGSIVYPTAKITSAQTLTLGRNVTIGDFTFVNSGKKTSIKDGSQINVHAVIAGGGELVIGKHVTISYGALILTGTDTPEGRFMVDSLPDEYRVIKRGKTSIGNNVFVGANTIIMPNVVIEEGVVVRAFSYVDKWLTNPYHIYKGTKPVGKRRIKAK